MPKSDREKTEIRRQTEASSQPGKDRTAHEAARGKKKLEAKRNLTKHDPSDVELVASLNELHQGNDRVSAILGATLVEKELRERIRISLEDKSQLDALMNDVGAPLSSFSACIILAQALGLVPSNLANEMHTIRFIRNQFAHSLLSLTFDEPEIAERCKTLPKRKSRTAVEAGQPYRDLSENRNRFEGACWNATLWLLSSAQQELDRKIKSLEVEKAKVSGSANALLALELLTKQP